MKRLIGTGLAALVAFGMIPHARAWAAQGKAEARSARGAPPGQGQKALSAAEESSYVIGPQDVLDISVWKEADVSRTVPVRPDGKISLPLLNDVQAAGRTPLQLQAELTQSFKKFISAPQVTIIVVEINSRRVFVLGEVARPGAFPMFPNMTVLQALSTAGGFSQFAKLSAIYVLRSENGRQVTYPFNYKDVVRGLRPEQNITLRSGDTIVVP